MKKHLSLLAFAAMASMHESQHYERPRYIELPKQEPKSEAEIAQKRGLKRFKFGGEYIYALNEKNARRKAEKRGLI